MTCAKQKEQTGLKFLKNLTKKTSAGSGVGPGTKMGAAAETGAKKADNSIQKYAQQKTNVFKMC
jgi:hypothetical protein